ncbi:MAG TPA: branched-chain amino acid transport system II carrier protein [Gammaproteobacteria bacterium]|nr:branched-chain amino acid transport system II carrier protein [Gammaproteobacteria bacterium]
MTEKIRFAFSFTSLTVGIAIFSMFFGAGNVVFPLSLGRSIGEYIDYALVGLIITGIGGPLLGLFSTILFDGDCKRFFNRIGDLPAYLLVLLIIAIIGPFGAMPRCFTVSYSAITPYLDISLLTFSILSGILVLLCVIKRDFILPILGNLLSPILLIALIIIIIKGLFTSQDPIITDFSRVQAFWQGVEVGYDTMDVLASMFFAVVVWDLLKERFNRAGKDITPKALAPLCFMSSLIGGVFLALIYVGLSKVASENMQALQGVPQEALLSALSIYILGPKFAFIANIAVALACLTTVISLAATVADVIIVEFRNSRIGNGRGLHYNWLVTTIIVITVIFSNLGFAKIMGYLHPIISVCYPAVIVLAICNILYKLWGFSWVKVPVYSTFVVSLFFHIYLNY